jgi:branched-chain amino acid transport system substrate-binding protein
MLAEQINKAGGINGHPLEVIIEASKSDETQAVLAAKKLLEKDKVLAIIGPSTTGESTALIP